jgi:hypothetical protein
MLNWWQRLISGRVVNEDGITRAADKLFELGRHNHWWPRTVPHWRAFEASDRDEFVKIVKQIIKAGRDHSSHNGAG